MTSLDALLPVPRRARGRHRARHHVLRACATAAVHTIALLRVICLQLIRRPPLAAPVGFLGYVMVSAAAPRLVGAVLPGGLTVGITLGLLQLVGFFALAARDPRGRLHRSPVEPPR
jgi:hypothetical protein